MSLALAIAAGCDTGMDPGGSPGFEPSPLPDFYVGYETGRRAYKDSFAAKETVYLDSAFGEIPYEGGTAPRAREVTPQRYIPMGDYYFEVVDPTSGDILSTDALHCRRVHVDNTGVIDHVHPCTGVAHVQSRDTSPYRDLGIAGGGITVQLAPFSDSQTVAPEPDSQGAALYSLQITPVTSYPRGVVSLHTFRVRPPEQPVCSNGIVEAGEECDDGNRSDSDSCSAICVLQHLCC